MILLPLFFLVYILIWVGLVFGTGIISWRLYKSKVVTSFATTAMFLVMYWPAFGDYFPTVKAHKEYCEKEAGFKIYVTPEQWIAENPGVLEALIPYTKFTPYDHGELGNERIGMRFVKNFINENLAIQKKVETVYDIKDKKIIYEYIDFSRGYGRIFSADIRSIKFWLYLDSCYSDEKIKFNLSRRMEILKKFNTKWSIDK